MGAYYQPAVLLYKKNHNYQTFDVDFSGAKLTEHSLFGNKIVNATLFMLEFGAWKNRPLTWACDYSEDMIVSNKNIYDISNNNIISKEALKHQPFSSFKKNVENDTVYFKELEDTYNNVIILNNSKKEYLDLSEYVSNYKFDKTWMIHPFPLLTNSEIEYMGGGDYSLKNDFRGIWANDQFEIVRSIIEVPSSYKNISSDFYFYADEADQKQSKDLMKIKILRNSLEKDRTTLFNKEYYNILKEV